jgi:hypothetical protein
LVNTVLVPNLPKLAGVLNLAAVRSQPEKLVGVLEADFPKDAPVKSVVASKVQPLKLVPVSMHELKM